MDNAASKLLDPPERAGQVVDGFPPRLPLPRGAVRRRGEKGGRGWVAARAAAPRGPFEGGPGGAPRAPGEERRREGPPAATPGRRSRPAGRERTAPPVGR